MTTPRNKEPPHKRGMITQACAGEGASPHIDSRIVWVKKDGKQAPALLPRQGPRGWSHSIDRLKAIAESDKPILLTGETGTGKDLLAQHLHDQSGRKTQPFVPVNCAMFTSERMEGELFGWERGAFTGAIADSPGLIAEVKGGTLFLDELGKLDKRLHGNFLRLLQNHEYKPLGSLGLKRSHARVLAAAQRACDVVEDLQHRFHFGSIEIPPLRERGDDIFRLLVLPGFLDQLKFTGITLRTLCRVANDPWPGNIRQLANYCEQQSLPASPISSRESTPLYVLDDPMPKLERDNWYHFASFCLRLMEKQWQVRQHEFQENPHIANTIRLLLTLAEYDEPPNIRTSVVPLQTLVDMLQDSDRGRYHVYDFRFLNEGLRGQNIDFEDGIARRWGDCALPDALVLIRDYVKTFVRIVPRDAYPDRPISEKFETFINEMISIPPFETPQPPPKPIEFDESKLRKFPQDVVKSVIALANAGKTPRQIQQSLPVKLKIPQIKGLIRTHSEQTSGRPKSRGGRPPK